MWEHPRNKKIGAKFRRQHPGGIFILDFYSHEIRLVIEIDGKYHNKKHILEMDENRSENIVASGLTILRFTDEEIISDINKVLIKTRETIDNLKRAEKKEGL